MSERANIVVIGGGIMGLAIAYNLAEVYGVEGVVVLEKSYLCSGASGRNGGGVRAQFSTEANVRLMQESLRICSEFASEMKINVWFRQGGYLFLVRDEASERRSACRLDRDDERIGKSTGERYSTLVRRVRCVRGSLPRSDSQQLANQSRLADAVRTDDGADSSCCRVRLEPIRGREVAGKTESPHAGGDSRGVERILGDDRPRRFRRSIGAHR